MNRSMTLPSFIDDNDLQNASAHLLSVECRELWKLQRPIVERYGGGLHSAVDSLLGLSIPDSPKIRHWCFVSREVIRANSKGTDPEPSSLSHLIVDSLEPERLFLLHTMRLIEALLASAITKTGADSEPILIGLGRMSAPKEWDLGTTGTLRAKGIGRPVVVRIDATGLTLDEDGPLIAHETPSGKVLRVDARYQYYQPVIVPLSVVDRPKNKAIASLHLPVHERGLREPYAASAPVVSDPVLAAGWAKTLRRACELVRQADDCLLEQTIIYSPEILPLYQGLGQNFASASNPNVLGYIYLPAISTPLDVAECLVHEAMHQKLFRIELATQLFAKDSPSGECYYSPWRQDPRPLNMVLHGSYVFTFVVHLWLRWAELQPSELAKKEEAYRIAMKRVAEVLAGINLLRQFAKMTSLGARLVDEIESTCRGFLEKICVPDAVRAEINNKVEAHRQHHLRISICSDPITS